MEQNENSKYIIPISIEELFSLDTPKFEWQEDLEEKLDEYHGDTYMPPFTYDRCFKLVKKLYYKKDYSNYRWYCIYKDFWYDCGSICKNCKYNR